MPAPEGTPVESSATRPCRVLVIEDNPGDLYLIRWSISEVTPCELLAADDGAGALALLESIADPERAPDVIVMDANLPGLTGAEVLARVRELPLARTTPVIVFTGLDSTRAREELAAYGVSEFLVKPVDAQAFLELGRAVRRVLDGCA
jgi:CheY-like chemotaxis protein